MSKTTGLSQTDSNCSQTVRVFTENGADIRFIQQLLGHEKLDTTAIYTEVSIKQLQEVHARCHPSAKLETRLSLDPTAPDGAQNPLPHGTAKA